MITLHTPKFLPGTIVYYIGAKAIVRIKYVQHDDDAVWMYTADGFVSPVPEWQLVEITGQGDIPLDENAKFGFCSDYQKHQDSLDEEFG